MAEKQQKPDTKQPAEQKTDTAKPENQQPDAQSAPAQTPASKHMPVFRIVALLALFGFILTGMYRYLLLTGIALVLGFGGILYDRAAAKKGKDLRKTVRTRVILLIACIVPVLAFPPLVVESPFRWQYPFQKYIINMYRNIREPEWFPEISSGMIESGYHFSYTPSIMQGTGHYSIAFNTTPEQMTEFLGEYRAEGGITKSVLPLSECIGGGNSDSIPTLWLDEEIRKNVSEKAWVCVVDAVYDWNHPHTSAIILDSENNRVQFLQLG